MNPGDLAGVFPILYAFFDERDRLDRDAMKRQVEACIRHGAHGIAALGLATEVSKLTPDERLDVMRWCLEDTACRLPVAITVFGETPQIQLDFCNKAADHGAAFVILQPPPRRPIGEDELLAFFGTVADAAPLPVAIQNAPQYMGCGLEPEGILELRRRHPNFRLLKGEAPALQIAALIEALGGEVAVFNGRGGLELPDILRAGCAGMIPAPECFDVQVLIFEAMKACDTDRAERLYAGILPLITFLMQSVPQFLCYGKRLTARRLGLGPVHDRAPAQRPVRLGLEAMERYAIDLGPFDL